MIKRETKGKSTETLFKENKELEIQQLKVFSKSKELVDEVNEQNQLLRKIDDLVLQFNELAKTNLKIQGSGSYKIGEVVLDEIEFTNDTVGFLYADHLLSRFIPSIGMNQGEKVRVESLKLFLKAGVGPFVGDKPELYPEVELILANLTSSSFSAFPAKLQIIYDLRTTMVDWVSDNHEKQLLGFGQIQLFSSPPGLALIFESDNDRQEIVRYLARIIQRINEKFGFKFSLIHVSKEQLKEKRKNLIREVHQ